MNFGNWDTYANMDKHCMLFGFCQWEVTNLCIRWGTQFPEQKPGVRDPYTYYKTALKLTKSDCSKVMYVVMV